MAPSLLSLAKHYHGRIQAALYLASAFLGLIVAICVGTNLRKFQGTCFLFAQVVWNSEWIWPWSESSCDFVIYFNLGLTFAYALAMFVFTTFVLIPHKFGTSRRIQKLQESHIRYVFQGLNPTFMVINSLIAVLVLCAAATLTGGFMKTCDWLVEAMPEMDYIWVRKSSFSCIDAQKYIMWHKMKVVRGITRGVDGFHFFNYYLVATLASWILVLVWTLQVFFSFFVSCTICSCEVAEEKRPNEDKSFLIAQRRSRMATPIGTPGRQPPPPAAGWKGMPPPQYKDMASVSSQGPPYRDMPSMSSQYRDMPSVTSQYRDVPSVSSQGPYQPRGPAIQLQPLQSKPSSSSYA